MPTAITWPALEWEPQAPWVHRDALAPHCERTSKRTPPQ